MTSRISSLPITHRSFVNTWECDENRHMNVQFYFRAFQQASEVLALSATGNNPAARTAIVRHVRYHRELVEGRPIVVRSGHVAEGKFAGSILHLLEDGESGMLAATALDQPGYKVGRMEIAPEEDWTNALPRGIQPGPLGPEDIEAMLESGRAITSHAAILRNFETGPDGDLLANAIISRFTDGAPHVWTHAGIATKWLSETNQGRVAVEMKLTRLARSSEGRALSLVSWIGDMGEKTFSIRHQLQDMMSGEAIASGEVRCLVMDLTTRRAVPVPHFARDAFNKY
ncbi:MAG: acyl-ACP thioesterase [Nitratireductor sp.]|nr:acyl-ACP thioesterase [Nitratireductor sp.]